MNVSAEPTRLPPLLSGHRILDVATFGMALPLFASYWIKHTSIPRVIFPLVYSWALASVVVVPVLIAAEIAAICFARADPKVSRAHALFASVAAAAMAVFLVARQF
jgi:predicted branched-subunit amino acid permease